MPLQGAAVTVRFGAGFGCCQNAVWVLEPVQAAGLSECGGCCELGWWWWCRAKLVPLQGDVYGSVDVENG